MENLEIHGDFDWSDDLLEIGNLLYDQIRGAAAVLNDFDYMISLDDYSRMGALRFKKAK